MAKTGYEGSQDPERDSAPGDYEDRDAYERIARANCLDGPNDLPVDRAGEANDDTNGFRPSSEPEGATRETHGDHPATFSGGPRPSRGSSSAYFTDEEAGPYDSMRGSRGPVASEEFSEGTRITGGRSDL